MKPTIVIHKHTSGIFRNLSVLNIVPVIGGVHVCSKVKCTTAQIS